jgi:acetyl esterase/lipase
MAKLKDEINAKFQKVKLAYHKSVTDVALKLVTHTKKHPDVEMQKDISYGTNKFQRYDVMYPKNITKALPVVFYVHGGAWCSGDKYGYTNYCSKLSRKGYVVVNIDYRLMPKVSIKTTVADCIKAIRHFVNNSEQIMQNGSADFGKTFMIGDSAGAHIVSLIAGKISSKKLKLKINVIGLGLYYGVFDFNNLDIDPSPILRDLNGYWKSAETETKELYKEISTTTYVTKNYPPCFITTGEVDKLHYQSDLFMRLITSYGIECDYLSFDKTRLDGKHAFLNAPILKTAKEAFKRVSEFFEKQLIKVKNDKQKRHN